MRKAIRTASKTLHELAEGGYEECGTMQKMYFPNLKAAETLLKFGLATQKLLKGGHQKKKDDGGGQDGQKDLFDKRGPWDLKDPDEDA